MEDLEKYLSEHDLSSSDLEDLIVELGDYENRPVDINTFIDSPEYLGGYFQGGLYDYWREQLNIIYPSPYYSPHWMVVLRGSLGQGKTTIANAGVLYDLYKLLCLMNPQKSCDLIESTKIVFMYFSITKDVIEAVAWDQCFEMMQQSPFFSSLLQVNDKGRKKNKRDTILPKRLDILTGSKLTHGIGKAVVSVLLDEANFGTNTQMLDNFNGMLRRMQSRFNLDSSYIPGRMWVISSETDGHSTINTILDTFKDNQGVITCQNSLWEVKTHLYADFPEKSFNVFIGNERRSPEVIPADHRLITTEPGSCILVPDRHRNVFEADVSMALKDFAGVAVGSSHKLFKMKEKMNMACSLGLIFPEDMILDFENKEDEIANKALLPQYFYSKSVDKATPRYIHLDIGLKKDRLGIACSYVERFHTQEYFNSISLTSEKNEIPIIKTEWCFGVRPVVGNEVPLSRIVNFIKWLISSGFNIGMVTADQFQSSQLLQTCREMGINTKLFSTDRTTEPYTTLRDLVYNESIVMPNNSILRRELEDLERSSDGKKIDHPLKSGDLDGCFVGTTKVSLLNGTEKTLSELEGEEGFWVYGCQPDGEVVPVQASCRFTKKVVNLVEITLDNGEVVKCTPDHKFMMRDGSYKEAKDLKLDDSLMPLYRKVATKGLKGYRLYKDNRTEKFHFEHRQFCQQVTTTKGMVVHHKNYDKLDNSPDNLQKMTAAEHRRTHNNETKDYTRVSQGVKNYHASMSLEDKKIRSEKISRATCMANGIDFDELQERKRTAIINKKIAQDKREARKQIKQEEQKIKQEEQKIRQEKHLARQENKKAQDKERKLKREGREALVFLNKKKRNVYPNVTKLGSAEYRQRQSEAGKARYLANPDYGKQLSESLKSRYASGELDPSNAILAMQKSNSTPEGRAFRSSVMKKNHENPLFREAMLASAKRRSKIHNIDFKEFTEFASKCSTRDSLRERFDISPASLTRLLRLHSFTKNKFREKFMEPRNHKVVSVEIIKLDTPESVYDLSVPLTSNFALTAGIFVHNSKDISDAVCGSACVALENANKDRYANAYSDLGDDTDENPLAEIFWPSK